ncbi:G-alpha-domain-containing protein [Dichomitus squalens LYAD-421 SS1]|uniref:G-alpha-domain-containing protein n=1 Tax=Dichomitus squalens (strain LYAD-421) TaxID=732165 RepID=UPI0004410F68|nr:G-alpha-domain-containing protein [Dichomitus squalens LYAD-421 SS1]EJF65613.1 G-alpha-domain-containing protein [Dichomitus squalens LYAD-421 SS1]
MKCAPWDARYTLSSAPSSLPSSFRPLSPSLRPSPRSLSPGSPLFFPAIPLPPVERDRSRLPPAFCSTDSSNSTTTTMRQRRSPAEEEEALRISNAIDEELRREREAMRRRKAKDVKVMLLGQAESGKSTLQKQFQLYYSSSTLDRERASWRPIVYFNILKAIRMILEELDWEYGLGASGSGDPLSVSPGLLPSTSGTGTGSGGSGSGSSTHSRAANPAWFPELGLLRNKLLPLVASEDALASELSGGVHVAGGKTGVYVRSGWQALTSANRSWPLAENFTQAGGGGKQAQWAVTNIVAKTLAASMDEVEMLWWHPGVQSLLKGNKLKLEEYAAFFLANIRRIAQADYMPSNEDILHVRLQTIGVTEHAFDINLGGTNYNWLLYDVGGARGQRHAWVPFFDDATAIIFLAPISAFDQYLEEDPKTNRIDDSLQLFTTICSNKLLSNAALVLMLNKTDLLRQKLESGIKVRKYISSYGDRPNEFEEVSEYFRAHFIQVHKRKDVSHRPLYLHFTSMLDIKATQSIIINVGEAIMRSHLTKIGLA